jgi:outer membrane protein TolC
MATHEPAARSETAMTKRLVTWYLLAGLVPGLASGQTVTLPAERLSLDRAVRLAVQHNRQLASARMQVANADEQIAIARTRRRPIFTTEATASQLLSPVSFSFPAGSFGEFPATGPIPSTDTTIKVPRQPTLYVQSSMSQPLTQLIRVNIGIDSAVTTRELDRTVQLRVAQQVQLKSDALDVQFRLAREELTRTTTLNTLASQKERLNQLIGRDVRTAFEVDQVLALSALEVDLEAAQRRALDSRSDLRQARLAVKQADLDRRLTSAGGFRR